MKTSHPEFAPLLKNLLLYYRSDIELEMHVEGHAILSVRKQLALGTQRENAKREIDRLLLSNLKSESRGHFSKWFGDMAQKARSIRM